jgi:Protein of unknown function (DUF3293)
VVPESEDAWASYQRTVVEILRPEAGSLRVRSAPAADETRWPWPDERPVHLLTAWDPGSERPGLEVNRVRQAALEVDLGQHSVPLSVAVGVDPVTGRREEGVAVQGLPEAQVLALGERYGQDAVFAWTPSAWAVVACRGGRRATTGWFLEVAPTPILLQPGT